MIGSAEISKAAIIELRKKHYGPSCQLFFRQDPLRIVRAIGTYMFDDEGQKFIDCINNVAHVGHCHPYVVERGAQQMGLLYTNNRFLHEHLANLARRLTDKLPPSLSVCYFTNSGSEANDLALQIARAYTKQKDIIILDNAYHGTVTSLQEINPYKWKQNKEFAELYKTPYVHVVSTPDTYNGTYRDCDFPPGEDLGQKYADEVAAAIDRVGSSGRKIAGYIAESLQSCGGQIIYPDGYIQKVYSMVREAGGLCIADEVQVGYGRVGTHYWAFQTYGDDVIPDIVTVGKPMGNGHPIAAVVTTREVADRFKLPYFNTYGGNPVSCAIALAVMDVIEKENLVSHAALVGSYLMDRLDALKGKHSIVGDVRGRGLFVGLELVKDRSTRQPATAEAAYVLYRLRHDGVLLSRDGPNENVLKFKPPMSISCADIDAVIAKLDAVFTDIERGACITEQVETYHHDVLVDGMTGSKVPLAEQYDQVSFGSTSLLTVGAEVCSTRGQGPQGPQRSASSLGVMGKVLETLWLHPPCLHLALFAVVAIALDYAGSH